MEVLNAWDCSREWDRRSRLARVTGGQVLSHVWRNSPITALHEGNLNVDDPEVRGGICTHSIQLDLAGSVIADPAVITSPAKLAGPKACQPEQPKAVALPHLLSPLVLLRATLLAVSRVSVPPPSADANAAAALSASLTGRQS